MGLLHSKNACKRRESPEGGTLLLLQGESCPPSESHTTRHKQDVCGAELRDDHFLDHGCPLEVILPPERAAESQSYKVSSENGDPLRRNAKNDDMSSLMHTIYEVVEASVKQSALCDSKTLRVKLSVTPLISSNNRRERDIGLPPNKQDHLEENHQIHIRGQSTDPAVSSEKKLYRIDENTERRNHYLDLAGIENYTSRFDADHMSPYEEQCQDSPAHGTRSAHHRWPQLDRGSLGKSGGRRLPFLRSLRSRSKSNRLHGHHPVSWCCPPAPQQQPLHYSHSKRVHARPRDATSASVPHPGLDLELQPGTGISPGGFMPMAQRHEHHHLHEHHHHHHHHHHYYSS
ncbi:naked cuticle-like protein 3 isoform X2 [Pangasianodon hypophthalmus]|uniref:naked cuticle-like protein 3 isoform X2 n=1 Tax=Pangasianodon hypophthalmus TaxID=310915 RepID=UPI002307AF86|nr:naked cuticle-like protein 3 isoform X2 [Pangasianodon hypophthalmus]